MLCHCIRSDRSLATYRNTTGAQHVASRLVDAATSHSRTSVQPPSFAHSLSLAHPYTHIRLVSFVRLRLCVRGVQHTQCLCYSLLVNTLAHRTRQDDGGGGTKFVRWLIRDKEYNTRAAADGAGGLRGGSGVQPWHWIRRPRSVITAGACARARLVRATNSDSDVSAWMFFLHIVNNIASYSTAPTVRLVKP